MSLVRIVTLMTAVLIGGALVATIIRVSDERDRFAAQFAEIDHRDSVEHELQDEARRLHRDLSDLLEENDQLYLYIGTIEKIVERLAIRARWSPDDCPDEIRELLAPYFTFLTLQIGGTGEDEWLERDMLIFARLCLERPRSE